MDKKRLSLTGAEIIPSEEEIALVQLERLRDIARQRLLSSEEAKIYDILVKNLRLSQGQPTTMNADYTKESLDDSRLIEVAGGIAPKRNMISGTKKKAKSSAKNLKK